jgi:GntR family transcriptional regulator, rspAB operon transcriptional repressor
VIGEHRRILDGIERRDPAAAVQAIAVHLDSLLDRIGDAQQANPLFFTGPTALAEAATPPRREDNP